MPRLLRPAFLLACSLLCSIALAQTNHLASVDAVPAHPRILLAPGGEKAIARKIAADPVARQVHELIMAESGRLLQVAPLERVMTGKRLLHVSREALRRLFFLSYAYRMSGDARYAARGEREMLAVAAFTDWNPSHFLDVGEMTMAMAIGYDWLNAQLPVDSRARIREAIIAKGIDPSLVPAQNSWLKVSNNWNQVCNAGMVFGAMAVYEDQPDKARAIINRAIDSVALPMQAYMPDGAYPEGYNYWGYGTGFNVLLVSALENMFGQSFGLGDKPGFMETADYLLHMTGPSGLPFNYSDAVTGQELFPAMFWYAQRRNAPSLLWQQRTLITDGKPAAIVGNRLLPALMLWLGEQNLGAIAPPAKTVWSGQGSNPVALMRSSWTDPAAIFVGIKGGSPSNSHGHMDGGSFVMDADGVRWAMDFGMQEYESLESKKVDLWNMKQDSQRWQVFRYGNQTHNTLTVNGQLQQVDGKAYLTAVDATPARMSATVEMAWLYKGTLSKATRQIAIVDKAQVSVVDEVAAGPAAATVRWTMLTGARVELISPRVAELRKNGKRLRVHLDAPLNATLATWPTTPPHDYDAANPGTTLLGFDTALAAGQSAQLRVRLVPVH
ncbi:MAG: heparinase II/III family protein [Massilia sp.]